MMRVPFLSESSMRLIAAARRLSFVAMAGSVCLLAACGMDPPPAAGQAPADGSVAPVLAPAGLALITRDGLTRPAQNADGIRCNIESMGDQLLETAHANLTAGRAVKVVGWYALPPRPAGSVTGEAGATAAPPASADVAADMQTDAGTPPVAAADSAARKPMLVIATEGGSSAWVVALPELRERRDVMKAFDDPALGKSGFNIKVDLSALPDGRYGMYLSDEAHSAESICGLGRGFIIK